MSFTLVSSRIALTGLWQTFSKLKKIIKYVLSNYQVFLNSIVVVIIITSTVIITRGGLSEQTVFKVMGQRRFLY